MKSSAVTPVLVRRTIVVNAPKALAFEIFTSRMETWWPMASHKTGASACAAVVLEPHAGGRWFERGTDGVECDWGRVLEWQPLDHVLLAWQLNSRWKFDPALHTEVEVRFSAIDAGATQVTLEHRGLEAYGTDTMAMRDAFSSPNGWGGMLELFASSCQQMATRVLPQRSHS